MKYTGTISLLCTAIAILVSSSAASATIVTTTTGGTAATPTIHAVSSGGHVKLANPIAKIECASTVEAAVEKHGPGITAEGNISTLTFTGCTNSWHVTTVKPGALIIHWTSGHNGLLTSTGAKVDTTRLGVTCVYETNNTSIGTITGGSPATLKIEASIPLNTAE